MSRSGDIADIQTCNTETRAFCIPRRDAHRTPGGIPRGCPASISSGTGCETGRVAVPADTGPAGPPRLTCSAHACREEARWALRWNNPRLHPPQRRKTWLACGSHRTQLGEFLSIRGFLRETLDVAQLTGLEA